MSKMDSCHNPLKIAKESEKAVAFTEDGGQTFTWLPKSQIETATLDLFATGPALYVVKVSRWLAAEKQIITRFNKHRFTKIMGGF